MQAGEPAKPMLTRKYVKWPFQCLLQHRIPTGAEGNSQCLNHNADK